MLFRSKNKFLVPFDCNNVHLCFASRVLAYIKLLKESLPKILNDDHLFHKPLKTGYGKAPMGINYLAQTGCILAAKLKLEDPTQYTGHCFRRTSATAAANAGANTLQMKRHFGWQQESTALKYTDETRVRARKMARFLTETETTTKTATVVNDVLEVTGTQISNSAMLQVKQEDGRKVYNFDLRNAANFTLQFN